MKHKLKISILIIVMFLVTQFIGLYVVNSYATQKVVNGQVVNQTGKTLPYEMGFHSEEQGLDTGSILFSFLFSLLIAIGIILILVKIKARFIMRAWFFVVSAIALGISFTAFLPEIKYASWIALAISLPFVVGKVYGKNMIIHNLTELFIYPGIAAIFVQVLNLVGIIFLLVVISVYDMWAVWKSKIMQKMAKFQMNELHILGGIMIPYASKKTKEKIKKMKLKYKTKKKIEDSLKKSKIRIEIAILGGGDIIFPIITSGVILKTWGLIPAIVVIFGALLGLSGLIFFGEKKKMYPAMPFISAGIFLALIVDYLFLI